MSPPLAREGRAEPIQNVGLTACMTGHGTQRFLIAKRFVLREERKILFPG